MPEEGLKHLGEEDRLAELARDLFPFHYCCVLVAALREVDRNQKQKQGN